MEKMIEVYHKYCDPFVKRFKFKATIFFHEEDDRILKQVDE